MPASSKTATSSSPAQAGTGRDPALHVYQRPFFDFSSSVAAVNRRLPRVTRRDANGRKADVQLGLSRRALRFISDSATGFARQLAVALNERARSRKVARATIDASDVLLCIELVLGENPELCDQVLSRVERVSNKFKIVATRLAAATAQKEQHRLAEAKKAREAKKAAAATSKA